jgi:hypothetical protein
MEKPNMEFKERSFRNLVIELSHVIKEQRDGYSSQPGQLNEDWTKMALILPLLEGLGWEKGTDIAYKFGPCSNENSLDLFLKGHSPIGIESKTLCEMPPQNIEHPQIVNGFKQCKAKKAPYFIWTNGDCWQFFSLSLANAPSFQVYLSKIEDDVSLLDKLLIIKKDAFSAHPERLSEAIGEHLEIMMLHQTWMGILKNHKKEVLQVFRKGLQSVDIKDEMILKFLKTVKSEGLLSQAKSPVLSKSADLLPQSKSQISFKSEELLPQAKSPTRMPKHDNWELLIDSYEAPYRLARWFFRTSYYRKLGEYLLSESYKPWSKDSTWRHVGLPNGTNEGKKAMHAVTLFQEWGFIKEAGADKYCRVDECAPYLKKLLDDTTLA